MKEYALLEYTFMFEPSASWSHAYQFEQDMAAFFRARGMEAQVVKTVEGGSGRKVLVIRRSQNLIDQVMTEKRGPGRPQTLKGKMNEMKAKNVTARERDFRKGKGIRGFERVTRKAQG